MANYSSVDIEFTNDWIENDKLLFEASSQSQSHIFTWKNTPSVDKDVEVGTPTATAGETAALNFKTAFDAYFLTGYTTSVSSNTITITSQTVGEEFLDVRVFSGSGTATIT